MKIVRCDNHPEVEAVVTLSVAAHPVGFRPLFGSAMDGTKRRYIDLCAECRASILFAIEDVAAKEVVAAREP